jgi:3D (Asp-Asp-Asp) domain-containing protein
VLSRKTVLIIAGYVLLILLLINLTHQLHLARQEVLEAREMERKSEEYQVKLMNVSMYAPLAPDAIGGWDFSGDPSRTASGGKVVPGETAAAGPNIPFGTRIYVEGLGWRTVNDRGSSIGPNDIDLAASTRKECLEFGTQQRLVIIKLPDPEED